MSNRAIFPVIHLSKAPSCPLHNGLRSVGAITLFLNCHQNYGHCWSWPRYPVYGLIRFKLYFHGTININEVQCQFHQTKRFYSRPPPGKKKPSFFSSFWEDFDVNKGLKFVIYGGAAIFFGLIMYNVFVLWYFRRLLKKEMSFEFPKMDNFASIRAHAFHICESNKEVQEALGSPIEFDERFEDYKIVRHYSNPLWITNPSGNFLLRFKIKGPLGKGVVHLKRKWIEGTVLKVEVVEGEKPRTIQVPISDDDMEIFDVIMRD